MASHYTFLQALSERASWLEEVLLSPGSEVLGSSHHDLGPLVGEYLTRGAKRLRPAVLLWSAGAVGGDERSFLSAAAAVELFHTWTLVHDDIIDHDELRRGAPTIHALAAARGRQSLALGPADAADYGASLAILTGDVLHGLCVATFLECQGASPSLLLRLAREMEHKVVTEVAQGEALDIRLQALPVGNVPQEQMLDTVRLKTAALFQFAGKAGAMLGLQTEDEQHPWVQALAEFCSQCGIAFQLQDDILGIVGDQEKLGKPVGSDLREGKRTLIVWFAYHEGGQATREVLEHVLGNRQATQEDIRHATELIVKSGAVDKVAAKARGFAERGLERLAQLPPSQYTEWLTQWAKFTVEREV